VRRENYDAVVASDVDLLKNPVVAAAVGTAAMAVDAAGARVSGSGEAVGVRAVDALGVTPEPFEQSLSVFDSIDAGT
jgi:hypothetical protein